MIDKRNNRKITEQKVPAERKKPRPLNLSVLLKGNTMHKKMQVFISSTYSDLNSERQAAVDAILKAGHIPAGMELFAAGDESQLETIKRWIDNSDIFTLMLGSRYGSIEPKSKKSYIEFEYDYAVNAKKPFFAIVISEKVIDDKVKKHGKDIIEQNNPQKLKKFRKKVLSKTSTFFDEPKDIKLAIFESISDLEKRYSIEGWVRSDEIQDTSPLLNEINRLSKHIEKTQKENKSLKNKLNKLSESSREEVEFQEIIRQLREKTVNYVELPEELGVKADEFTLLDLVYVFRADLLVGVCNPITMKPHDQFVFFKLAPELQIYELVENTGVPNVAYRRYGITKKGLKFIAYCEKRTFLKNH